ncbi:MAG: PfkB family carbohydrate kinase [Kofleriaceae bacterium]
MERPRVVGLGRFGALLTGLLPHLPDDDGRRELATMAMTPDAGVATALRAARALGCDAVAVGSVGADAFGTSVAAALDAARVDTQAVRSVGRSAVEIVWLAADGQRRVRTAGDPGGAAADAVTAALTGAAALLLDGTAPDLALAAARAARAAGVTVVLRPVSAPEHAAQLVELIGECDVLVASERVVAELAPRGELDDAARQLAELGPRAVVLTLGAAGALARAGEVTVRRPGVVVEALCEHGTGAVLQGALTAALLSRLPLAECLAIANTAAALACRALVPWEGVAPRDEIIATTERVLAGERPLGEISTSRTA